MSPFIVGLGHYSRTGKDTFANYLIEACKALDPLFDIHKLSLAWKLKDISWQLYQQFGHQRPEFYEIKENEHLRNVKLPIIGKTPVEIWVELGTTVGRAIYSQTWIDFIFNHAEEGGVQAVIIPDVRFLNEVKAIQQRNGLLIKVIRPGVEPKNTVADLALKDYNGWNTVVGYSGSLAELQSSAEVFAYRMVKGDLKR